VDSRLPFQHLVPLKAWMARVGGTYELTLNISVLFLVFGASALLLAALGLYAVVSYSVSRSTREIGIRAALGATASNIRMFVFQQVLIPVGTGICAGVVASFGVNYLIKSELVRVSPADPGVLISSAVILILAAALGCWIPASRAMRVNPVVALKHE